MQLFSYGADKICSRCETMPDTFLFNHFYDQSLFCIGRLVYTVTIFLFIGIIVNKQEEYTDSRLFFRKAFMIMSKMQSEI